MPTILYPTTTGGRLISSLNLFAAEPFYRKVRTPQKIQRAFEPTRKSTELAAAVGVRFNSLVRHHTQRTESMKSRRKIFGLIFLLISLLTASHILACTCGGDMSPRSKYDRATIVFVGTATEVTDDTAIFQIEKAYKGKLPNPFKMYAKRTTTCDTLFVQGAKYLVYASEIKTNEKTVLLSTVCDGTEKYADSSEDIKYLESPEKAPDVQITPRKLEKVPSVKKRKRVSPGKRA